MTQLNNRTAPEFSDENNLRNIEGFFPTLDAVPTFVPNKVAEQVVLVVSGGNLSLYAYDTVNRLWRHATLN